MHDANTFPTPRFVRKRGVSCLRAHAYVFRCACVFIPGIFPGAMLRIARCARGVPFGDFSSMSMIITTADVAKANSLDFWQDVVCRTFFIADCEAPRDLPFRGSIATTMTSPMAVSRLRSCGQHVVR